eukprot:scaffold37531_cov69-Attheya_sp.AAC.1
MLERSCAYNNWCQAKVSGAIEVPAPYRRYTNKCTVFYVQARMSYQYRYWRDVVPVPCAGANVVPVPIPVLVLVLEPVLTSKYLLTRGGYVHAQMYGVDLPAAA